MMRQKLPNRNRLLVEGREDERVIPQLIEAHGIPWGETRREWIVEIKAYDGVQALLRREVIETELQQRGLERLGIIVDANSEPDARWQALRNACIRRFPSLPETAPEHGVVVANDERQTIGLWMMPGPQAWHVGDVFS